MNGKTLRVILTTLLLLSLSGCAWCGDETFYWRCLTGQTPEIGVLQQ